jgi:hypothetical protein
MAHPKAIPGAQQAVIPEEKLAGYALNPCHETGNHKARVFNHGSDRPSLTSLRVLKPGQQP